MVSLMDWLPVFLLAVSTAKSMVAPPDQVDPLSAAAAASKSWNMVYSVLVVFAAPAVKPAENRLTVSAAADARDRKRFFINSYTPFYYRLECSSGGCGHHAVRPSRISL